jgi:hypothetical protein
MCVAFAALLAVAALAMALLGVPVTIKFSVQFDNGFRGRITMDWMFGLVEFPILPSGGKPRPKRPKKKVERKKGSHMPIRPIMAALRSEGFTERLMRLASDMLKVVEFKILRLKARLGLDDPTDTGQLWAFISPIAAVLANTQNADISLEPEFDHEDFTLYAAGEAKFSPLRVLAVFILFLISRPTLRALWAAFESRRK